MKMKKCPLCGKIFIGENDGSCINCKEMISPLGEVEK